MYLNVEVFFFSVADTQRKLCSLAAGLQPSRPHSALTIETPSELRCHLCRRASCSGASSGTRSATSPTHLLEALT